jgi:hypothetical protein
MAAGISDSRNSRAAIGSSTQKVLPLPTSLSAVNRPLSETTMRCASASPMPVPSIWVSLGSEPFEGHEEPAHFVCGNAGTGIANAYENRAARDLGSDHHFAVLAVELDGVGQQVQENLLQPLAVGGYVKPAAAFASSATLIS